ncbi:MAG: hypothetical protein FJ272_09930, partial [Planctomycetes bacterium]|nr:hypothetical protein [Planctomycetota bacterium]
TEVQAKAEAVPAQFEENPAKPTQGRIWWLMPPGSKGERRFALSVAATAHTAVTVRHDKERELAEVSQADKPVLRYHHGSTTPPEGIDKKLARGDYVSALYGPDGETLTDDYPKDHPHHRGVNWSWATVRWQGQDRDPFAVRGIWARPVRLVRAVSGTVFAIIEAESEWRWDDKEPVVHEQVVIRAFRGAAQGRCVDFEVRLRALVEGLQFCGRLNNGYSGFNLRMVPADGQQIVFHADPADAAVRRSWADYSASFRGGKGRAGVAILQHETNPLYAQEWRKYENLNFFQPVYPGGAPIPMPKDRFVVLRYRLWIHPGAATADALSDAWWAYNRPHGEPGKPTTAQAADPYAEIVKYEYGQSRKALVAVEEDIRRATPEQHEAIEAKLLTALKSPEATDDCKEFICRVLQQVGSARCVPALAELLAHKRLSLLARYALQRVPGPEPDAALRKALTETSGELKVGVIHTIADRGDRQAAPQLAPLVGDKDAAVARAAIAALGRLGDAKALNAANVPSELKDAHADAYLLCADKRLADGQAAEAAAIYREMFAPANAMKFRVAALRGIVRADREKAVPMLLTVLKEGNAALCDAAGAFVAELPARSAVTTSLVTALPSLPANSQVILIHALGRRGDSAAAADVAKATESKEAAVRVAALRALSALGGVAHVNLLIAASAEEGDAGKAAFDSLCRLRAEGMDAALRTQMQAADAKARATAIRSLAARRCADAVPALLKSAEDEDAAVRAESLKALAALADEKALPTLLSLLARAKTDPDRQMTERALVETCKRAPEKGTQLFLDGLSAADVPTRCSLLRVLGRLGGEKALGVITTDTKNADTAVKDAAVRALMEWPDASAATELLNIAHSTETL